MWCTKCRAGSPSAKFKKCSLCGNDKVSAESPFPKTPLKTLFSVKKAKYNKQPKTEEKQ